MSTPALEHDGPPPPPQRRTIGLPMFSAPRTTDPTDPPLPGTTPGSLPSSSSPTTTAAEPQRPGLSSAPSPSADGAASPPTSTSTDRRWRPGGDPKLTAEAFAGLFVLAVLGLSALARRRDRYMRKPTKQQAKDVAEPLARIACRHLPMDDVSPDLFDLGLAGAALHNYADDGPLFPRIDHQPDLDPMES